MILGVNPGTLAEKQLACSQTIAADGTVEWYVAVLVLCMDVDLVVRQKEIKKLGIAVFGCVVQRELGQATQSRVVCELIGSAPKLKPWY